MKPSGARSAPGKFMGADTTDFPVHGVSKKVSGWTLKQRTFHPSTAIKKVDGVQESFLLGRGNFLIGTGSPTFLHTWGGRYMAVN